MKVLKKSHLKLKNEFMYIAAERTIMSSLNSPYVVKLHASFQSHHNLCLIMEYVPGGDVYSLLHSLGAIPPEMAIMYIAELVLAVECVPRPPTHCAIVTSCACTCTPTASSTGT